MKEKQPEAWSSLDVEGQDEICPWRHLDHATRKYLKRLGWDEEEWNWFPTLTRYRILKRIERDRIEAIFAADEDEKCFRSRTAKKPPLAAAGGTPPPDRRPPPAGRPL